MPAAGQFQVLYDSNTIKLGSSPSVDLQVTGWVQPSEALQEGAKVAVHPPEFGAITLEVALDNLNTSPSGVLFPMDTISEWLNTNYNVHGNWGFNNDGTSNSRIMAMDEAGDHHAYDPQLGAVAAQYLVASSFGLMQVGMLSFNYHTTKGTILESEWDPEGAGAENHILAQVTRPEVSIRWGTALLEYHLYSTDPYAGSSFQTVCPETCPEVAALTAITKMLEYYNGSDKYPNLVLKNVCLFTSRPEVWGFVYPLAP